MPVKTKLTLSIDEDVLRRAKKVVEEKKVSLSGVVENFLEFLTEPHVYCFKCGRKFNSAKAELCSKCGWLVCPSCKVCRCGLDEKTASSVFHMRRVYEDLLSGKVK
jgi:ribosomal protein L37E